MLKYKLRMEGLWLASTAASGRRGGLGEHCARDPGSAGPDVCAECCEEACARTGLHQLSEVPSSARGSDLSYSLRGSIRSACAGAEKLTLIITRFLSHAYEYFLFF